MTVAVLRFSSVDWLDLGLVALSELGPPALTIEALCKRAGKTKGSFYAHFASSDAYLIALAKHWREQHTLKLMEATQTGTRPDAQLALLDQMALRLDGRVEQGMRRLAAVDDSVRGICTEVDRERIAYLAQLHQASGRFDAADSRALAQLEYAAFVGFQQIDTGAGDSGAVESRRLFQRLIGKG